MGVLQIARERDGLFLVFGGLRSRFYQHIFPLFQPGCEVECGHTGRYRGRCGDPRKDRDVLIVFYLYTWLYHC